METGFTPLRVFDIAEEDQWCGLFECILYDEGMNKVYIRKFVKQCREISRIFFFFLFLVLSSFLSNSEWFFKSFLIFSILYVIVKLIFVMWYDIFFFFFFTQR